MNKRFFSLLLVVTVLFCALPHSAQVKPKVKYWIKFRDKNGTPFSLSTPSAFLSAKSVQRRSSFNIPYHVSDLPLNPNYIKQVDTTKNVNVLYASKWLNGVVVAIDSIDVAPAALARIKNYAFVADTGRVMLLRPIPLPDPFSNGPAGKQSAITEFNAQNFGGSWAQTKMLNLQCLHNSGYRGQGITIAVMDAGFTNVDSSPTFDTLRNNGGILGTYDFVRGTTNAYLGSSHGTGVLSCMAGNKPGTVLGSAPMAKYWLFRTEDGSSETLTEEYNWIRAAEYADSIGVDMITTSLGYTTFDIASQNHSYATLNGRTAPMSIAATMAARKGIFVLNAAGNDGGNQWNYIGVPADADSICTVGGVDTSGKYAVFSSVGPTADGRIKPDIVAVGQGAWICDPSGACFPANGTSFATPIMAGAVACFWQSHRDLNNIQLLDTLRKRGSHASAPDNKTGWGIPKLHSCPVMPDLDFDFSSYYSPDKFTVIVKLTQSSYEYIGVEVVDLLGHVFVKSDLNNKNLTVYLSAPTLSEGIYLVKVKTSKGTKTKKFYK